MKYLEKLKKCIEYSGLYANADLPDTGNIEDLVDELANDITNLKGSYVVFEESSDYDGLIQLSIPLTTLDAAREYKDGCKNRDVQIYQLIEY